MIACLISFKIGLTSYYWWFGTVLIISVLSKIVFYGNDASSYEELVENYKTKSDEET